MLFQAQLSCDIVITAKIHDKPTTNDKELFNFLNSAQINLKRYAFFRNSWQKCFVWCWPPGRKWKLGI